MTIRPRNPKTQPILRYDYHETPNSTALQAPLTIESKECTVEGICFVLDQNGAGVPMAALLFRGVRKAEVRRCQFIQANPSNENRMTSVLIESSATADLLLSECCFLGFGALKTATKGDGLPEDMVFSEAASGGQYAVARRGPVRIEARNCLFGPHAATFRLEGAAPENAGLVRLDHCSVLAANQSAVFDVAGGADARIEANFSLFSHPGAAGAAGMAEGKGAVLLRLASSREEVGYKGRENRYHQLDSYLAIAGASEETRRRRLEQMRKDEDFRELESSPWKDPQPLTRLEQLSIPLAFQVNPLLPELRVSAKERANGQLIGAERALAFSYLDMLPALKDGPSGLGGRRVLAVENRAEPDPDRLLFPTLRHAVLEARSGDIIRLRLNGEVKLDLLALNGAKLADLTIGAAAGFHPVLTLSETEEVDEVDAALFRVHYGKLQLEDVEVRLQPSRDGFDSQSVVSFLGDGECVLKNCLITLDRAGRKTALAVAMFIEPGKLMKKSEQPAARLREQGPRFVLDNCFVRGQGDLVGSQGGQPAEVTLKNSLVALTGSLLNVEGTTKDMPAPTGTLSLELKKVTSYLGGHLIRVRAVKDLKSLAQLRCEPEACLFLPSSGDRALIHLEGPESEERGLKSKLAWNGGPNAYGSFNTLLEQQSIGSMMKMPLPSPLEAWKNNFSGETNSEYNIKLINPPAADTAFTLLQPSAFRTTEKLKDYGADLAALRQMPSLRGKSEVPIPDAD